MSSRRGERSIVNLLTEGALVTVGVFLALWANNWQADRDHRALAQAALRNFSAEFQANRQAMLDRRDYHEALARDIHAFLQSSEAATEERFHEAVHFAGMRPVTFERTAWDLALATQALSYLPPDLAFGISKVYTQQNALQKLQDSFLASAFTPASLASENFKGLATAMEVYLADVNIQEPLMLSRYGEILPKVTRALGRGVEAEAPDGANKSP